MYIIGMTVYLPSRPPVAIACVFVMSEFAMIGIMVDGKPLARAYSIASPNWAEELEFFSIKVPDGPLTSRLQHIQVGDELLISKNRLVLWCLMTYYLVNICICLPQAQDLHHFYHCAVTLRYMSVLKGDFGTWRASCQ